MRLIPKKTKVSSTIWLNFTLLDLLLAFCLGLIAFAIAMSNIAYKWAIFIAFISISVILFFSDDGERGYNELFYIMQYASSRKKYEKNGKKNNDISNLIPFKKIESNGIVDYGDYFGAVIEIGSVEFALLDLYEQNSRISAFANILNNLGENSFAQLVKIDRPINYDEAAAILFNKLEEELSKDIQDEAQIHILKSRLAQIDSINNLEKQYRPYYYLVLYDKNKNNLFKQVDITRNGFDKVGLPTSMLEQKDVAVFFKYCYTRNFDEREVEKVENEDYVDYVQPDKIQFKSSSYTSDDVYSFTCAISDYPLLVGNAWGAGLFNIDNTKVVLNIKPVPKNKAVKRIDKAVVELETRKGSGKLSEAISQETHVQTVAQLAQTIQNENEMLFDCTLTITGFNNTKESNVAFRKELRRQLVSGGFRVNFLRGRQFQGFASATISQKSNLKSLERGINSESLAAIFPFVFTSIIEPKGFTLGYEYYPVIIDIWKRNNKYINSNLMVLGKSGSGKSFFTKTLLSMIYSENSRIFILDPENEYSVLCKNVGGKFIDVGNATEGRINPLHIYQILTDDGTPAAPEIVFSAHLQFLESFFRIVLNGITSDALEELNNIITKVYELKGITDNTDCKDFKAEDFPVFDDLYAVVLSEYEKEILPSRKANLERIKTYVAKFASGGRYSVLWNGASTLTSTEKLIVFNFQSLLGSQNNVVSNAQMLVIMRYLDQQIINIRELNRDGKTNIHPFVAIDEGYNFIDQDNPVALDFVYLWYKRIRKYNGSIMFLTQNLSDILGNPTIVQKTTAIINNTQYSFIFALAPADLQTLTDLYKSAGNINETEQNQIANASNGECFLICSSNSRTRFKIVASDLVYTLFEKQNAMELINAGTLCSPYHN